MEALVEGGLGLGLGLNSLDSLLGAGGDLEAARAALLAAAVASQEGPVRRASTLPLSFTDMPLPYEHFAPNTSILSGLSRGQAASELSAGRDTWASSQQQQIQQQKQTFSSSAAIGSMPLSTVRMLLQAQALAHGGIGGQATPSGIRKAASGSGADRDRSSGGDGQGNHEDYEHRSGSGACSDTAGGSPSVEGVTAVGRASGMGSGSHKLALSKAASGFDSGPSLMAVGAHMALGAHGARSLTSSPARGASGGSGGRPGNSDAFFGAGHVCNASLGGEAGSQVDVLKALLAATNNPLGSLGLGGLGGGAGAGTSPVSGDALNGVLLASLLQQLSSIGSASSPMSAGPTASGNVGAASAAALLGIGGGKAGSVDGGVGTSLSASHLHQLLAQTNGKESGGVNGGLELLTASIKPEVMVANGGSGGGGGGFSPQQAAAMRQFYQPAALPGGGGGLNGVGPDGGGLGGVLNGLPVSGLGTLAANGLQLNQLLAMAASGGRMLGNTCEGLLQDDIDNLQSTAAAARENCDSRGGGSQAAPASGSSRSGGGAAGESNSVRSYRHGGGSGSDSVQVPGTAVNMSSTSGGMAKGPTGLHVIKTLVNSGAAGAGMVGLINGASGLADLAGLPGGVATQLMEDLESLGYRGGSAAGNLGGPTAGGHRVGPGASLGSAAGASSGAGRPGEVAAVRNGGVWTAPSNGKGGRWSVDSVSPVPPTASTGVRRPNKRPENGSLATQILKRQRAMQQAAAEGSSGGGAASGGGSGPAAADQGLVLGNAAGLGALGPPGSPSGGLAGVLGGLPAAAAAAAAAGLPPVSATAALLAAPPTSAGLNAAAIANAVVAAAARNGSGGPSFGSSPPSFSTAMALAGALGLHGLPGGGCLEDMGSGGMAAAAAGPASAAQLRALGLAGVPASAAAFLAASGLPRYGGPMSASAVDWLLGMRVPRGRRTRRTPRPAGPAALRCILKDLGLGGGRSSAPATAVPERNYSEADLMDREDGIANGSGSGRTSGKRVSGNGPILGGSLTSSNGAAVSQGPSPTLARRQRVLPSAVAARAPPTIADSRAQVDSAVAAAVAANAGDGFMELLGSLRWGLLTNKGAKGPLTAAAARAMAAALQSVEAERGAQIAASAASAAAVTAAARGSAPPMMGVANGGGVPPLAKGGSATAASGVLGGAAASRGGIAGPAAGKVTATVNGGAAVGAAVPAAASKSRRKGGAPSRAAD